MLTATETIPPAAQGAITVILPKWRKAQATTNHETDMGGHWVSIVIPVGAIHSEWSVRDSGDIIRDRLAIYTLYLIVRGPATVAGVFLTSMTLAPNSVPRAIMPHILEVGARAAFRLQGLINVL